MTFLDEPTREQIRTLLSELTHPLELIVYTGGNLVVPGRDPTGHQRETLALLREIAELGSIEVIERPLAGDAEAAAAGILHTPTTVFRRRGEERSNLRFVGLPSGYEFTTLLETLRMLGSDAADEIAIDELDEIAEPVMLQNFVTPTCPHCPRSVLTTFKLALANPLLIAEGIEASEFPILSQQNRIQSVPDTIVSGHSQTRVLGAQPEPVFLAAVRTVSKNASAEI
jgi:glutaredoxin-like protein